MRSEGVELMRQQAAFWVRNASDKAKSHPLSEDLLVKLDRAVNAFKEGKFVDAVNYSKDALSSNVTEENNTLPVSIGAESLVGIASLIVISIGVIASRTKAGKPEELKKLARKIIE